MDFETSALDLTEELRLRRWARENYAPVSQRSRDWHPVILNEMARRDFETELSEGSYPQIVPVMDRRILRVDGAHPLQRSSRTKESIISRSEHYYS